MFRAAVIADDFTSVTDCTISLTARGLSVAALLGVPEGALPAAEAAGLNTESRTLPPEEAYARSRAAAEKLREAGCPRVYKSVDSTLRGNLGAEIDGVLDGLGLSLALVAPAFPHYGRTTVCGFHYLDGVPLQDSYIARDPACPATESDVRKILASQSRRRAGLLPLSAVRADDASFKEAVRALQAQGCGLLIADAETEDDLARIAVHAAALEGCLAVGSTGLIRHLAPCWFPEAAPGDLPYKKTGKGVAVLAASVSPVTGRQIGELLETGTAACCSVPPLDAAFGDMSPYVRRASEILRSGLDLVFRVDAGPEARAESALAAVRAGLTEAETGGRIVRAFAKAAADLLSRSLTEAFVLTGGDMARAALQEFGSGGMELCGEVEPGIPFGRLMDLENCLAVTKAGAFGTPQALCTACALLKKE